MPDIVPQLEPTEFNFDRFEGDDFLWERLLEHQDQDGAITPIPLAGYSGEFVVSDVSDEDNPVEIFKIVTGAGYPAADGIILGTLDGLITLYKQDLGTPGDYEYAFRLAAPDTNLTTTTVLFGTYTIRKKLVTTP